MIQFFVNDVEISQDVNTIKILYIDSCDGLTSDSLEIDFSNTEEDWEKWGLEINTKVKIIYQTEDGELNTKNLYVDNLELIQAGFKLYAKSMPLDVKTNTIKAWEEVSLYTIFEEKASKYKFKLENYETTNHVYKRIEQKEEKDISFLCRLANLEGYTVKTYDDKIILINDEYFESIEPSRTINKEELLRKFDFNTSQTGILNEVVYNSQFGKISYKDDSIIGNKKEIYNNYIGSYAEGLRFAKGFLIKNNLDYLTCDIMIDGDFNLSAGNTINLEGFGDYDGKYFIKKIISRIDNNFFMQLSLRRV